LKKDLSKFKKVGIDTNFFIYYFQKHPRFGPIVKNALNLFSEHQTILTTSILTMTELLSFKTSGMLLERLEKEIMLMANLQLTEVNNEIAKEAARIRKNFGFSLVDAIQLATAVENNVEIFITNDKKLQLFKELRVVLLASL
jgi:predicted nucleic acid-binding protein